ncbi:MAG: 4-(cytidine 5'-diphospho)-2-C-methyl-D-erythritol kinase [Bacillota bacterium]
MNNIKIKTYAKINLCLDIISKRPDGYHDLKTIMQSLDLCDQVELAKDSGITVACDHPQVPEGPENIAYKAAELLFRTAGLSLGARIHIRKKIPFEAGLAGGSSNAAGVLLGLNYLYELNFTLHQLVSLAKKLGADVPFCLVGGTVLATGIGERLNLLPPLQTCDIVLVKPAKGISTKAVYERVDLQSLSNRPDVDKAVQAIEYKDLNLLSKSMGNVLEPVTCSLLQEVAEIKEKMLMYGAAAAQMCGSGPTVFAICSDQDQAQYIYKQFRNDYSEVFLCKTT